MENMNPSQSSLTHRPNSGKEGTPFTQSIVHLTKQEHVQLKWDSRYWQRQHARAIAREAGLKQELERAGGNSRFKAAPLRKTQREEFLAIRGATG